MKTAKHWWTFAGRDGRVTLLRHTSQDAQRHHYAMMRAYGGPQNIGMSNGPLTLAQATAHLAERFADIRDGGEAVR